MKKIIVSFFVLSLVLLLVGCMSIKPTSDTIPPNTDVNPPNTDTDMEETTPQETVADQEIATQSFEDIYHKAEWIYSLFTRYGKLTYAENEILYNNERYQWDLAKLAPTEFYNYYVTGIYPLPK